MRGYGTSPRRPSVSAAPARRAVPALPQLLLVRRRVVDLQRVSTSLCSG